MILFKPLLEDAQHFKLKWNTEDSKIINMIKKYGGKFISVDNNIHPGKKAYIWKDKDGSLSYSVKSTTPGRYLDDYEYPQKDKSVKNNIQNSFIKAWDEYFYDEEHEEEGFQQQKTLQNKMKKAGWKYLGKVSKIGIDKLKPNDAVTQPDSNEFYQFVLPNNIIQTLG